MMRILTSALALCFTSFCFTSCQSTNENAHTTATTTASPPVTQEMSVVPRPQTIVDLMKQRGEQDEAKPTLKVLAPANNATINGATVEVKLDLSGDLKG